MTLQELAAKSMKSILDNGLDNNRFLAFVKEKLNNNSKFYENIPDDNTLPRFAEDVTNGDIELNKVTMTQSEKQDYWNRGGLDSFLYTARILPKIYDEFPLVYEEITEGKEILPAGLDPTSRRDKKAKTIWNLVANAEQEQREQDKKEDKEDSSDDQQDDDDSEEESQAGKFKNSFLNKSKGTQSEIVRRSIQKENPEAKLEGPTLEATTNYIRKLLRSI